MPEITSKRLNYQNPEDAMILVELLDAYAQDPMGGGEPLPHQTVKTLAAKLAELPNALSLAVFVDGKPAGLANCFFGFSTFAAAPLINIHDLAVLSKYRGLGLSQRLLQEVEKVALEKGCCKVTLEVLSANNVAKKAYLKFGFAPYSLDPEAGEALFWQKSIQQ
ncbi:GNAT family N-acetyltransferase [Sneathiella limimaris]|uniref:GNAT family N-acetyltransferase n=1 Tax=Sneathiella limimaris TaxID=1964213 RepID=UPI00146C6049|nr:GNAT family N-acetyltransferase [Sneathiella limimaris]